MTLGELKLIEFVLNNYPNMDQSDISRAKQLIRREIRLKMMDASKSKETDEPNLPPRLS